jgi:Predicted membrane protein (DUF2127)
MDRPPGTHPQPRPRRKVDWELVVCGWEGHALVGTDAAEVRPEDDLFVREAAGTRWHRCLRCDSWVALPPPEQPAREHPPERSEIDLPLRGRPLRDKVVLRVIAVDRAFHFLVLMILGISVLAVAANQISLEHTFYRVVMDIQGGAGGVGRNGGHPTGFLGEIDKLFSLRSGRLREVGIALIAYGLLEGVEAVGLWMGKRWAEYLTFIATTVLLPLEIYEIIHKQTPLKIIGFIINLAVVVYLIYAKRLFGVRGGGAAEERERERDLGWDAIERSTAPAFTTVA